MITIDAHCACLGEGCGPKMNFLKKPGIHNALPRKLFAINENIEKPQLGDMKPCFTIEIKLSSPHGH